MKKFIIVIIISVAVAVGVYVIIQNKQAPMDTNQGPANNQGAIDAQMTYVLEINRWKVKSKVLINERVVYEDLEGKTGIAQVRLDSYLQSGQNNLTVFLGATWEGALPTGRDTPSLTVKLMKGEPGTPIGSEEIFFEYEWHPAQTPLTQELKEVFKESFSI